jgi:hypothetical protein
MVMVKTKKLYEDIDVEVFKAPTEEELEQLIKDIVRKAGRPLTWKELREQFAGIAGEDRLRKVLIKLIERDELIELPDGAIGLPGMEQNYIPRATTKRVRPLVPSKFRARWGNLAAKLRKTGLPLGEALKQLGLVQSVAEVRESKKESEKAAEEVIEEENKEIEEFDFVEE